MLIDSLLRTLNPPDAAIDREWIQVARRRLAELRTGTVKPVSGETVFADVKRRLKK